MRSPKSKVSSPKSAICIPHSAIRNGGFRAAAAACLLILGLLVAGAAPGGAPAPQAPPLTQAQEDAVREIASQLRCPVCQNLSVADSPSGLANEMRGVIRERLRSGESREQVQAYFVSKYGEWVLLAPMKKGFNLLAWVLPFVGIVVGALFVTVMARRWAGGAGAGVAGIEAPEPPTNPEDAQYRERLRRELDEFAR